MEIMSGKKKNDELAVSLFSFGFKYGSPKDVNLLFDVRFLPNPYWVEGMREKSGKEPDVASYVIESEAGIQIVEHLTSLLPFLVNQYSAAEKNMFSIGVGCTGGRHRSVALVERLGSELKKIVPDATVFHRDIEKDSQQ